jgi:hypothetical protein
MYTEISVWQKFSEPFLCGSLSLFQNLDISINLRSAHIANARKLGYVKLAANVRRIMPVVTCVEASCFYGEQERYN